MSFRSRSGKGSMQRSQFPHHLFVLLGFIGVDGLRMLAKVVETGELFTAMAAERTFACVFAGVRWMD
jgi:hypothetical protein